MSTTNQPGADFSGTGRRGRVGGSGFTVFRWDGNLIAFARQISNVSPAPVGPGAVPIQPLDSRHPVQIITPEATSMGTLTVEIYELYGQKVWDKLKGLANSDDLVDIFHKVANTNKPISMSKHVNPPGGANTKPYHETYFNCVITNVLDGETIEVGTMEILKQVTVGYTHMKRSDTQNRKN